MAESGIPDKFLPAVRVAVFWIGLPFIGLLLGGEDVRSGNYYWAAGWISSALLSIIIAVYWDSLLPPRWRSTPKRLEYLRDRDSELGTAIRDMVWRSAWGKWFSAQIFVNGGKPASEETALHAASHLVADQLTNGDLEARGRLPRQTGL